MSSKVVIGGQLKNKDVGAIPVSRAIRSGDYIHVSGQMSFNREGALVGDTIEEQTALTIENIQSILSEAGADLSQVIKCTCWISDENEFQRFNETYSRFFSESPPARSCIPSKLLLGAKVEIEATAYAPEA